MILIDSVFDAAIPTVRNFALDNKGFHTIRVRVIVFFMLHT